jgi:hypothetical protein
MSLTLMLPEIDIWLNVERDARIGEDCGGAEGDENSDAKETEVFWVAVVHTDPLRLGISRGFFGH